MNSAELDLYDEDVEIEDVQDAQDSGMNDETGYTDDGKARMATSKLLRRKSPMRRSSKLLEGMWAGDLDRPCPAARLHRRIRIEDRQFRASRSAFTSRPRCGRRPQSFHPEIARADHRLRRFTGPGPARLLLVFAEFQINDRLAQNIKDLLDEVGHLCNIEEWKMKVRGVDGVHALDDDLITKAINRNQLGDKIEELRSKVDYLKSALSKKDASPKQEKEVSKKSGRISSNMDTGHRGVQKDGKSTVPHHSEPRS
jgi:hypothetical protein